MWWGAPVEAKSAFMRLLREQIVTQAEFGDAMKKLTKLRRSFGEIQPTEEVRSLAEELLERCAIRAADAFQLASAVVLCQERPRGRLFVCFDRRLCEAADFLGFSVLPNEALTGR